MGSTTIHKIYELSLDGLSLGQLLPEADEELLSQYPDWLPAGTVKVLLERAAKDDVLYFSSHLPLSSAGKVTKEGDGYRWSFSDDPV